MASLSLSDETASSDTTGCSHYKRKCQLVSPCCGEFFSCRFCHDSKHVEDWKLDPDDIHALDRHLVSEVVCTSCQTRQSASNLCVACNISFAAYYCDVCHLYDDAGIDKELFHCDSCGICRVGGRENYEHCNVCNLCLPVGASDHQCRSGGSGNCPVCLEDLFSSREPNFSLRCQHRIHVKCFNQLQKTTVKCPLCSESFHEKEVLVNMNASIDAEIAATPMPAEYANMDVEILCNDCHQTTTCKFHIFGHKCVFESQDESGGVSVCGSYNTRRV